VGCLLILFKWLFLVTEWMQASETTSRRRSNSDGGYGIGRTAQKDLAQHREVEPDSNGPNVSDLQSQKECLQSISIDAGE
jgi:hypothetical protein